MTNLYDDLNISDLVEEFDRLEKGNNSSVLENFVMFPKEGPLSVRLLPPAKGKRFYCETRIHRLIFPNGQKKNIHCTRTLQKIGKDKRWLDANHKDPCPICKYYSELWAKSDVFEREGDKKKAEEARNQARLVKPQPRYYYNSIVRQQINPKTEEIEKNVGPKILSIPQMLHQKIIRAIVGDAANDEAALGDISDPKTGRDLKIIKRIKGGYPEYNESKFLDSSSLGDKDQVNKWLANLHDLSSYRRLATHAEMTIALQKYLGLIPLDAESDDETSFGGKDLDNSGTNLEEKVEQMMQRKNKPSVVKQAEEHLGGSGNDDAALSDEEFFEELENM